MGDYATWKVGRFGSDSIDLMTVNVKTSFTHSMLHLSALSLHSL